MAKPGNPLVFQANYILFPSQQVNMPVKNCKIYLTSNKPLTNNKPFNLYYTSQQV